jgi:alpha-glucosidase
MHHEHVELRPIKNFTEITVKENSLLFTGEEGVFRVKVLSANCLRITFNSRGSFLNVPSAAVENEPVDRDFILEKKPEEIILKTKAMNVKIARDNCRMIIRDLEGNTVCEDSDSGFFDSGKMTRIRKRFGPNDHFYGLGEKTGYLDKKGRSYQMWNRDHGCYSPTTDPLYVSIPLLIVFNEQRSYGIFADKTCKLWFDMKEEFSGIYSVTADDFEFDYYFIYGPELKYVTSQYAGLTGKPMLPPLWSLGFHQSRYSYCPEQQVEEVAESFRAKDIPCDVIHLDIDYMDGYRVFTWDRQCFREPAKMIANLRDKGFKVVTIIDPGVKKDPEYLVYREGIQKGLFCKWVTGEVYHGKVWPGDAAYPDFSKAETRRWWGECHKAFLEAGVAGIWNDMNEPADESDTDTPYHTVPDELTMENDGYPRSFAKYHNLYGFLMCRATHEGFGRLKPENRYFLLTRSAYAGIQKYAAVWTGDNCSWWEHLATSLPMFMNMGLSGVPFIGADVGGFAEDCSAEIFARWVQLGAFTPLFRVHSAIDTIHQEPWRFGPVVENIARKYIKLRYRLLPYLYNEFFKASQSGLPVIRPLVMEFPSDENVHRLSDQFLLGEDFLVAPIYLPATFKRCVYLPAGVWYDYWSGERYEGEKYILADAPLDKIPVFVRGGAMIPQAPPMNYVGEVRMDPLTLVIYPGSKGKLVLYEDDGCSNRYKDGEYSLTAFAFTKNDHEITLVISPIHSAFYSGRENYRIEFRCFDHKPLEVKGPGVLDYSFDDAQAMLYVNLQDCREKQTILIYF